MERIERADIANDAQLCAALGAVQKDNPGKYITYTVTFGVVRIYVHDRKPQSTNVHGAEYTYRHHGGFLRDGKTIAPSETFVRQFDFCPILG
jgi:hypothetical protein